MEVSRSRLVYCRGPTPATEAMMKTNHRVPRVRGVRAFVAMLPNGNTIWLKLEPTPVPVRDFDRLADSIEHANARLAQALGSQVAVASRFVGCLKRDAAKLNRMRQRDDRKLRDRISAGDKKLGRRVDGSLKPAIRQATANRKRQKALLRKQERRELWNQLVLVSAAPMMAAFGQRSNPLAENNLVIVLSLAVWLFGDEVADMLSGKRAHRKDSIKGLDVWSYTAPIANLLTGWWLLNGRQHDRFITGVTDFKDKDLTIQDYVCKKDNQKHLYAVLAVEDLSSCIAPDHLKDFRAFQHVPVVATIQTVEYVDDPVDSVFVSLLRVAVINGLLWLVVKVSANELELKKLQVAWIVDTREPTATPLSRMG